MAGSLDNAWRGLEEVDGLAATKRHWVAACGHPLFKLIDPFLSPTGKCAEWIPDPSDSMRMMRVVESVMRGGKTKLVAISEDEPRSPDVPVSGTDLAVYCLDLPKFGRHIASALGFGPTRSVKVLSANTARLASMPSHGLEVILVLPCREDDLYRALDLLRGRIRGEFALITPTHHTVPPHVRSIIDQGTFQHATLGELLAIAEDGSPSMLWNPADCFSPVAGVQSGGPYSIWPHARPPHASWGHVSISLRLPDTLRIEFGTSVAEFGSRDIVGLVKRTSGQHMSESWELLTELARNGGTLPIESSKTAQDRVKTRRKVLADLLKKFFGLNSAPFATSRRDKVWAANFGIRIQD